MRKARAFSRVEMEDAARLANEKGVRVVLRACGEIEFIPRNFTAAGDLHEQNNFDGPEEWD